nr:uncharacterized mitochondrial protein AtMg00810-like [Tanacetum cinerariifolium]
MGLWYPKDTVFELTAFSDSDHAGCFDSRKSTSGGIQFLGGDKLVSWSSKKQDYTSMSFVEAKYVSLSACCAQVLWMRTQLTDYGFHFDKIPVYCYSKAAIAISCNPLADLFTKSLPVERFQYLVRRLDHSLRAIYREIESCIIIVKEKKEVEDHRSSVKLSKNKTSVTACNDGLNAKTLHVKSVSTMCDKCVLIDKHDMCVLKSVDKPFKETVASESNNKPRKFTRKLYEHVSKTCSWWYPKFTPSGYIWKPKSRIENINPNDTVFELTAFSDSDHAGCFDSRKSTSGGIQFLGGDKLVSWSSKKQDYTSMSFVEAKYVSLSACCAQVLWMRTQLTDYGFHFDKIPVYCYSKAAIAISCNPV